MHNIQSNNFIDELIFDSDVLLTIIFCILGFLIGIIHDSVMDWFWKFFRNNRHALCFTHKKECYKIGSVKCIGCNNNERNTSCKLTSSCCFTRWIWMAVFSIIYPFLPKGQKICEACDKTKDVDMTIVEEYYKAYYIAEKRERSPISLLEGQVAFIRNMLFPLLALAICYFNAIHVMFIAMPTWIALLFTMFHIQEHIYTIVWEDSNYLKKREE